MLERLKVGLAERSYPIWIGEDILDRLGEALLEVNFPRKSAVVTNTTVHDLYEAPVRESLRQAGFQAETVTLPDGEEFKNLNTLENIFESLIRFGLDRTSGLIALGGGVVGDMTGFAAATYLRGIPFAQVPTTLLSQVDSSVGGKTGVNHALGKNLIGAFHQPRHVHIDVRTLTTLSSREFSAGMAEVIKYGIIRDRAFFDWLSENRSKIRSFEAGAMIAMVKKSCQIKADIVEEDEKEASLRAILNFGHTFGHAVETLAGYGNWRHGEAVAVGMIMAAIIALREKLCTDEDVFSIRAVLRAFELPVDPPGFPLEEMLSAMGRDKKVKGGILRMILNRGIGDCEIRDIPEPGLLFADALTHWREMKVLQP